MISSANLLMSALKLSIFRLMSAIFCSKAVKRPPNPNPLKPNQLPLKTVPGIGIGIGWTIGLLVPGLVFEDVVGAIAGMVIFMFIVGGALLLPRSFS